MSTFKVGDRVRVATLCGACGYVWFVGRTYINVRFGEGRFGRYFADDLEPAPDVLVTDLTLDELPEWIADWFVVEFGTYELESRERAIADAESVPGGPISAWYDLRDELLEAYAARLRESVQP